MADAEGKWQALFEGASAALADFSGRRQRLKTVGGWMLGVDTIVLGGAWSFYLSDNAGLGGVAPAVVIFAAFVMFVLALTPRPTASHVRGILTAYNDLRNDEEATSEDVYKKVAVALVKDQGNGSALTSLEREMNITGRFMKLGIWFMLAGMVLMGILAIFCS